MTISGRRRRAAAVFWQRWKRVRLTVSPAGTASEAERRQYGESAHEEEANMTGASSGPMDIDLTLTDAPENVQENQYLRRRLKIQLDPNTLVRRLQLQMDLYIPTRHLEDEPRNNPTPSVTLHCPICMNDHSEIVQSRRQIVSTVCGHIFCSQCLPQALWNNGFCPTCRRELADTDYHPIYI